MKKNFGPNLDQKGQKWTQNLVFCHFLKLSSLVFLEIVYNHSLQHCIISSRSKTYKKIFGHQIWTERAKNGRKTMFFCHVLKLSSLVFLEIVCNHSLQHCIISSRSKTHKKNFGHQIWTKRAKNGHKTMFFALFSKWSSLVFLEIVCNHSLQHCIISSRSKTHKKNFGHQIWAKRAKNGPKTMFFCHIFKFRSLVSLEIACNNSLQQVVTTRRGKIKKLVFFCYFLKIASLVFL